MNKKIIATTLMALSFVSSGFIVSGCTSTPTNESTGQYIDSSSITGKVKAKLLADESVKALPITVTTYKNVVQLSGFVDNYQQRRRAIQIARSVPNVKAVINALTVKTYNR